MWHLKYCILFLGIHLATVTSKHIKFYRKDYTYIGEYDAFYKLHIGNNISWKTAFLTCENEDSKLFYPSEADEWQIVDKLRETMAGPANITDVMIGVHNQFNIGEFLTVDGRSPPLPLGDDLQHVGAGEACVTMKLTTGSYVKGPCSRRTPTFFVCKKLDPKPCSASTCPTIDPDYKYSSQYRKCYKVNKNARTWQEAMQVCYMEGGLLAVAEDRSRVNVIRSVTGANYYSTYFVGIRDLFDNGDYYTVEGKNIGVISTRPDQVSKHSSDNTQRLLPENKDDEYELERDTPIPQPGNVFGCGIVTGESIEAASCYDEMPFICEMEAREYAN